MKKVTVVIPAYNETTMIDMVVSEVVSRVDEVIVVDDGSSDDTGAKALRAGAVVATHSINRDQGGALQTGITLALHRGADVVVTYDADGQFVADEIERVVEPLLLGSTDVVLGSRFLQSTSSIPMFRKCMLSFAAWVTKAYTGLQVTDTHNGFRAFSRTAAEKIVITQRRKAHASEILEQIKKHKLRYVEVPVTVRYTEYSMTKGQKATDSFKIIWDLIFSRIVK